MNYPVKTVSKKTRLRHLAKYINDGHMDCAKHFHFSLNAAIATGELLLEAKQLVEHGEWLKWLETNCPKVGIRMAQRYMRYAAHRDELQIRHVTHLAITKAMAVLSAPLSDEIEAEAEEAKRSKKESQKEAQVKAAMIKDGIDPQKAESEQFEPKQSDDPERSSTPAGERREHKVSKPKPELTGDALRHSALVEFEDEIDTLKFRYSPALDTDIVIVLDMLHGMILERLMAVANLADDDFTESSEATIH